MNSATLTVVLVLALASIACSGAAPASFDPHEQQHVDAGGDAPMDLPDARPAPEASVDASGDAAPADGGSPDAADDATPDAAAPEAEAGPMACDWVGPTGATYGCWPLGAYYSQVTYACEPGGQPSFLAQCAALGDGGATCAVDAGPCSEEICTSATTCSLMSPGLAVCIDGTAPAAQEFAGFAMQYSLQCYGGWRQITVQTPSGSTDNGWCCASAGCCP